MEDAVASFVWIFGKYVFVGYDLVGYRSATARDSRSRQVCCRDPTREHIWRKHQCFYGRSNNGEWTVEVLVAVGIFILHSMYLSACPTVRTAPLYVNFNTPSHRREWLKIGWSPTVLICLKFLMLLRFVAGNTRRWIIMHPLLCTQCVIIRCHRIITVARWGATANLQQAPLSSACDTPVRAYTELYKAATDAECKHLKIPYDTDENTMFDMYGWSV